MAPPIMPFGKFKGLPVDQIPASYLGWLLGDWVDHPERLSTSRAALVQAIFDFYLTLLRAIPACRRYLDDLEAVAPPVTVVHQLGAYQLSPAQRKLFVQMVSVGYKRLAGELHPDHGGSGEDMAVLNSLKKIVDRTFAL